MKSKSFFLTKPFMIFSIFFCIGLIIISVFCFLKNKFKEKYQTIEDLEWSPYFSCDTNISKWNGSQVRKKHPFEFPEAMFMDFYLLNFDRCKTIVEKNIPTVFPSNYMVDLYSIWVNLPSEYKSPERKLLWYPRDRVEWFEFPILVKTREIKCFQKNTFRGSILFKLNISRHFSMMEYVWKNKRKEKTFLQKQSIMVWRGKPTGYGFGNNIPFRSVSREVLMENWYNRAPFVDIGLTLTKKDLVKYKKFEQFKKPELSIDELLEYKYILSIEGNDVATNLKWIMASNSLVVMPTPQIESWFLESELKPFVHYLPLKDDFSDLEEQYFWAEKHPEECLKMIQNANEYVRPFLDEKKERQKLSKILCKYLDTYHWE